MQRFPKLYVAESNIHGKGLFAGETIQKGQIIGQVNCKPTKNEGPYVLWINSCQSVEVTGKLRYINHSAKANAVYYNDLTVVALKKIPMHTEITHYYGEGWD